VVVPTVREPDGLALSSRNVYLSPEERGAALGLSAALAEAHAAYAEGERAAPRLEARIRQRLQAFRGLQIEYIGLLDPERFTPRDPVDGGVVVAVAGRVGSTRLIDNIFLDQGVR
jgi:pantoate--beta-alanine ligase